MAAVSGEPVSLRAAPPRRTAAGEVLGTRQETDGAVLFLAGAAGEQQTEQPQQENEQQQENAQHQQIEQRRIEQQRQIQERQPISQQQQVEPQHRQSQEEHQQIQEQLHFQAQQQVQQQQQLTVVVEQQQLLEEFQQPVHEQQSGVSVAPAVASAQLRGENWTVANIKTLSAAGGDGPAVAERELAAVSGELEAALGDEERVVAAAGGMGEEAPIDVDGGEERGGTGRGEQHENELLRTDDAQLYVVMPSMAQTIEKMLAAADVQYKDERVVHALVDLLQREALTVLADAAELVDLRKAVTDAKTESTGDVALRQQQQGGRVAAFSTVQDAVLPGVRFRIEEVDARAAMQEYIEKYVAQPDVLLDRVRLCSLSNSRAVGEGSFDTVLQQLYAPAGSMDACLSRASFHFAGSQHKYQEDRENDLHGGRGGSTFFLGDGFAEAGKSMKQICYGGKSASAGAFGGVGGAGSSGDKNPLGRAPNGLPPYLPEDVNVYTGMPQWTVKSLNEGRE